MTSRRGPAVGNLATLKNGVNPLTWNVPIANSDGTPTNEFMRKWVQQAALNGAIPDLTTSAGVSARLDLLGATPGMLLERGATTWGGLASPADATKFLNGATFPAYAFVKDSDLALTDITTNNVTNLKHGFAPKSPADVTKFLNGGASPAYAAVKDSDLSLSNITTNDVSIARHGFAPIAPNDATKFLNGLGAWAVPAGGSGGAAPASALDDGTNFYLAVQDAAGQLVLDGFGDPIFIPEILPVSAIPSGIPFSGLSGRPQVAFKASASANQSVTAGVAAKIQTPTVAFNLGAAFNASTYVFTAPVSGYYQFNCRMCGDASSSASGLFALLYVNGVETARGTTSAGVDLASGGANNEVTELVHMAAGDTAELYGLILGGTSPFLRYFSASQGSRFQGLLMIPD
jgi:hypothetical protein